MRDACAALPAEPDAAGAPELPEEGPGAEARRRPRAAEIHRLKMPTGKIRADINFINPYPCAEIRARARARNPQQVENDTRTRYPRIPAYPRVRPHTRKF